MHIKGHAKKDLKTKKLISRLKQNDIAVICHENIDEVAAIHLIEKKVGAVINCAKFISGDYPNRGPKILIDAGIPLINNIGQENFIKINENDLIEVRKNTLHVNKEQVCEIEFLTKNEILDLTKTATKNLNNVLHDFVDNTLDYAAKEKDFILKTPVIPDINVNMTGRHVLVVTRGSNYKSDLKAISPYLKDIKPIIIGVDGGADAILEFGYKPDLVIGDMDSVSDICLKKCKEIIVHAYQDGRSPGLDRVRGLGLNGKMLSHPGTSEDIALILAYENKAELIVTLGSHTNMIDFLEKGRKGMASTVLVQMKVGHKIIDAKGVSELYKNRLKPGYLLALFLAAFFPVTIVAKMSPLIQELYQLIALRIKLIIGL